MKKLLPLITLIISGSTLQALTVIPKPVVSIGTGNSNPQISVNADGFGLGVWSSPGNNINGTFFNATTQSFIGPFFVGVGGAPQVGIDNSGNGLVIWVTASNQIQAARFSFSSKTFTSTVFITSPTQGGFNISPKLSVGQTGNAIAVWLHASTGGAVVVQGATFSATTGLWSAVSNISINPSASPVVGTDKNGSGVVLWQDLNTGGTILPALIKP